LSLAKNYQNENDEKYVHKEGVHNRGTCLLIWGEEGKDPGSRLPAKKCKLSEKTTGLKRRRKHDTKKPG